MRAGDTVYDGTCGRDDRTVGVDAVRQMVYVSGPYTFPDKWANVERALKVADDLWNKGFCPYVPHLTHYWDQLSPKSYDEWLEMDLCFLPKCDILVRIPGESKGADIEVAEALRLGLKVDYL